jgi:hypothetical protein
LDIYGFHHNSLESGKVMRARADTADPLELYSETMNLLQQQQQQQLSG